MPLPIALWCVHYSQDAEIVMGAPSYIFGLVVVGSAQAVFLTAWGREPGIHLPDSNRSPSKIIARPDML